MKAWTGARAWPPLRLWPRKLLMAPIRLYRLLLSPWLGSQCRFTPTCSAYALQALDEHGAWRGTALSTWRILRCHPWCAGGCDPVPPSPTSTSAHQSST